MSQAPLCGPFVGLAFWRGLIESMEHNDDTMSKRARLTKLEKELLARAAEFALAGEWPWEGDDSPKEIRKYEREHAALISARDKLQGADGEE
jgi:hypothetical protein